MDNNIFIRNAVDSDLPFIFNSWLLSYQQSKFVSEIRRDIYFKHQTKAIANIITHPTTYILIISEKGTEDLILGFAVYSVSKPNLFHYIYIKKSVTGFGLPKMLFDQFPFNLDEKVYATHLTYQGEKILNKYHLTYNPYMRLL